MSLPERPRRYRVCGYSHHAAVRAAQRWFSTGNPPPKERDWMRAFEVPPRWASAWRLYPSKGVRCVATADGAALMHRRTVITVVRVGRDAVDDLRAVLLCRAMGLDAARGEE